jgi:hypothetical protein
MGYVIFMLGVKGFRVKGLGYGVQGMGWECVLTFFLIHARYYCRKKDNPPRGCSEGEIASMTTDPYGYCPRDGIVPTKYDFSYAVIILCVLLIFFLGIGLFLILVYILYVVLARDKVCSVCGAAVYPAPMYGYPQPYYPAPAPPYQGQYYNQYQYPPRYPPPGY